MTDTVGQSESRGFTIIVNPKLVMLDDMSPSGVPRGAQTPVLAELHADGGVKPYRWAVAPGSSWPEGLPQVDPDSGRISGHPDRPGMTMVRVQVTDAANHIAIADLVIKAMVPSRWRRPVGSRRVSRTRIARLLVTVGARRGARSATSRRGWASWASRPRSAARPGSRSMPSPPWDHIRLTWVSEC